jgi:Icc-related predicted phosphoesterase
VRILFTSDTHGYELVLNRFADMLRDGPCDCGVIAGDILDDNLPGHARMELLGLTADDLIPELPAADDDRSDATPEIEPIDIHSQDTLIQASYVLEERIRAVLARARKPIFVVRGNHDLTTWETRDNIYNIHWKRATFRDFNLVGYHHTEFSRTPEQLRSDCQALRKYIDRNAILVTHSPAYGTLDDTLTDHLGREALRDLIEETQPRLHLFGHVHRESGYAGRSVNGSWSYKNVFYSISVETRKVEDVIAFPGREPVIEYARRVVGSTNSLSTPHCRWYPIAV